MHKVTEIPDELRIKNEKAAQSIITKEEIAMLMNAKRSNCRFRILELFNKRSKELL